MSHTTTWMHRWIGKGVVFVQIRSKGIELNPCKSDACDYAAQTMFVHDYPKIFNAFAVVLHVVHVPGRMYPNTAFCDIEGCAFFTQIEDWGLRWFGEFGSASGALYVSSIRDDVKCIAPSRLNGDL